MLSTSDLRMFVAYIAHLESVAEAAKTYCETLRPEDLANVKSQVEWLERWHGVQEEVQ